MRVAIVEDDSKSAEYIEQLLNKEFNMLFSCDFFDSGEDLLSVYKEEGNIFKILFMDIEMKSINGVETANAVRAMDKQVIIIFITCHESYAIDCFECRPLQFLLKPIDEMKFNKTIVKAMDIINEDDVLVFHRQKQILRLNCNDIYYFEGSGHNVNIHFEDEKLNIYMTFSEVKNMLDMNKFAVTHKSFIVNMEHIKMFADTEVKLTNSEIVPISRSCKPEFKEQFFKFMKRREYI